MTDDVRLFLELDRSFLNRMGCEVMTAASGAEALERARSGRPDLVVLDARMPDMDGPACCRELKSDGDLRDTPVIFLTTAPDLADCLLAGADGAVQRPLSRERLLAEILEHLPLARRRFRRRPTAVPVEYRGDRARGKRQSKDVGEGGLFLRAPDLGRRETVELTFRLPLEAARPLHLTAHVVREVGADPDSHLIPGVGLRFDGVGTADRKTLSRFVARGPGGAGGGG